MIPGAPAAPPASTARSLAQAAPHHAAPPASTARSLAQGAPRRAARLLAAGLALLAAACDRAPVRTCADPLGGLWRSARGAYHVLDLGTRLELHPSFRDLPTDLPPGIVAAPTVVDLARKPGSPIASGTIVRRYERGTSFCRVERPATLLRCTTGGLTLELIDPTPPTDWTACTGPSGAPIQLALTR